MSSVKSRLSKIICLVLVAIVAVTAVPLSFAWLANSLEKSADFTSYIHKSYFESGDGTTADQFIDGTHQTEEGCAFEIKYPVQLYYFAWLQALGYFNVPDENGVIQPTYFYLSDDLDMTGFILPQIGTQTYPFVGSFDGNGHTITNLQVQNVETSGGNSWTDKPEDITGLNIVGMFGVIGSLNDAGTVNGAIESGSSFTPTAGYTYSSLTNEVKNFIVDGANIKTDLSESLVGIAAGYVNGTMENVKVVGGTISNVSATTSTSYTTNLSDFGAVGYCTDPYKGTNQVTTVKVYDPQAYTNSGGGTAAGQGNNWGGSVDMLAMYTDLRTVYTSAAGSTNGTYPTAVTITHHTDGTTTETVTGTGTAPLSVTAGGRSYPIRVTEVDDNGDVIASYSIVQRDDTADFVYLYGEKITDTRTAAVTDVYEKDSVYIYHDNDTSHNLSFNGTAFSDAVRASATKWVMEDGENSTKIIYTIVGNNKYYLKNDSGTLSFTSTGLNADIPADATEWNVTDTKIYNDGRYLCYRNGTWQLLLQERLLITDDNEEGSQHFLTVVNGNYANTMVKADAVSWIRTMASDDPDETEFYLHTEIGGNSYYLKQSEGLLVLETNPVTPSTKWKYKAATETEKSKVYTLINDEGDGYALYYDDSDEVKNWALTDFSEVAAGSGSGDSFGDSIPMTAIYNRLSDAYDLAMNEEVTYAPSETVNITKNSQGIVSQTSTTAAETSDLPTIISYSDNDGIGSYSFARHPSGTKQYLYLYGEDDINVNDFAFGYFETYNGNTYITDGAGHYVYYNGSNGLSSSTSRSTAYTYNANNGRISFTSSYTTYYFQFKNGTVSTDTANNSTTTELNGWEVTDGFIHHGNYYLVYADGRWVLRLMKTTTYNFALNGNSYFIKDANDNYLTATASGISNTTSPADAVAWDFSTRSGSGTVSTYIDGTRYYLYRNNTQLGIRDTAYTWTINNNHIYDGNYYVSFNSSWGLTTASTYYLISYGTNYLSTSGSGVENRDEATATRWSLSETAANTNTTISTLIGNTTYYLYVNSSNWTYSLTVNTSSQNWRRSGTATGTLRNRTYTQYYAVYRNNAWTAYNSSSYSLTYTAVTEGQNSALSISQSASYNVYSVVSFHTKPTYLPLSVDSSTGEINRRNTGYIVSGSQLGNSGYDMPGQFGRGDIRVSYYPISTGNYNISSSVTNNQLVTTKVRTIDGSGDDTLTTTYVSNHFHKYSDDGTTEGSLTKMNNVLATDPNSRVYGLHFMNAAISEDNTITIANAKVNGHTYESYELPQDAIDFTLKERGYINFFAGTYFSGNNSFFSLHKIERNSDGTIASIKEILEIYGNGNEPYYYKLQDKNGTITYESWEYYPSGNVKSHDIRTSSQGVPSGYSSVFNTNWIKQQSSLTSNAVYYFEVPVDQGEYALGSVNGGTGAYLMYLDIGAAGTALKPEGNAKLEDATFNDLNALHADAGIISYTVTGGTRDSEAKTYPTYYPLAWNNDTVATTVSSTNTGYVVGGAHTNSTPPGDIRVSRYDKDSRTGTSYSIWRSLNNGGTLNNGAVYTIVNGTQQTITNYGIGNQYTQNYGRVVNDMNDLLDGEDYVYGMHFMEAAISTANIVTVPKAVINETTYTDYQMPEDCIDFVTQGRGRITFFAGTFFSGSSVNCFFSLNKIFRDGSGNITDIKKITNIYGNGTSSKYVYKYSGDSNYYYSDSTTAMTALPIGYSEIFDLTTLSATRTLTQDAVYYFEIPVDAGEYALGSADGNGAYLLYLDIAANARFDIKTTITEVTETIINELVYPEGVAFVDAANSTAFDTDGKADPEKSVFLSIPITNSSGDTTFSITSAGAMTVTNTTSTLNGYESMSIPDGNSLTVNNGTPVTSSATVIVKEIVTEIDSDPNGSTITTVTTTTQTTVKGGTPTTTVEQTVTTTFGASSTTVTTSPAPAYDGHTLIPTDYTVTPNATADTIIEYTFTGRDLTNDVSRDGDLNIVLTGNTITVNGSTFTVCDVVKDGDTDAGTYEITISGTAGTYTVNVTKIDTDFVFTLNGAALSATGQRSVTVSP